MKRSTIIGCFIGILSLSLSAQTSQLSSAKSRSNPTKMEARKKTSSSIQELLTRRANIGPQLGAIATHFSIEEQKILKSYFSTQQPTGTANIANTIISNGSAEGEVSFGLPRRSGPLTTVYGVDNPSTNLIGFGPTTPEAVEVFGSSPIVYNFEDAGAIDPENPSTGYVIDDWENSTLSMLNLVSIPI